MNKTRIEWTDYTWNPIRGLCPIGCWYCYARKIYRRFSQPEKIVFNPVECEKPYKLKKPSKIFVCSTIELFHPDITETERNWIFETIENNPQHTFQILTKLPQNIDRPMPDNVWLGVSVTGSQDTWKTGLLEKIQAKVRFVSNEPMLDFSGYGFLRYGMMPFRGKMDWVILGRLTGHGHKYDPKREWIEWIVENAREWGIPVFLKDNLKEIWGEPLIQEFPE